MKVWIQKHDYKAIDYPNAPIDEAMTAFRNFDWIGELEAQKALIEMGKYEDCCDPGIGFVHEDQTILHVCPCDSDVALVHYSYSEKTRIFGLISYERDKDMRIEGYPLRRILDIVEAHYAGDHEKTRHILKNFEQSS